jgi:RNA recognition motif-containing protein
MGTCYLLMLTWALTVLSLQMREFFKDLAEVKQVRWLTDKVSGEFRGCGFVEFYDAESVDKVREKLR